MAEHDGKQSGCEGRAGEHAIVDTPPTPAAPRAWSRLPPPPGLGAERGFLDGGGWTSRSGCAAVVFPVAQSESPPAARVVGAVGARQSGGHLQTPTSPNSLSLWQRTCVAAGRLSITARVSCADVKGELMRARSAGGSMASTSVTSACGPCDAIPVRTHSSAARVRTPPLQSRGAMSSIAPPIALDMERGWHLRSEPRAHGCRRVRRRT